jgi:dimethylhistidine N-methyltransferase
MTEVFEQNFTITQLREVDLLEAAKEDLKAGLKNKFALVPTLYFYDDLGSKIFRELCAEPSYYLPRAELRILENYSSEISKKIGNRPIIELGCGDCHKSAVLLNEMMIVHNACQFIPVDVSLSVLEEAAKSLKTRIQGIQISAVNGTYFDAFEHLYASASSPCAFVFLGSTMAQFTDEMIADFLSNTRKVARRGDLFLVGFDLHKSAEILKAPYNSASARNHQLNGLRHINRLFDGNIDVDGIRSEAIWNERKHRIEMTLKFTEKQNINLKKIKFKRCFQQGETTLTHIMRKMTADEIVEIFRLNNMRSCETWFDERNKFGVFLFEFN